MLYIYILSIVQLQAAHAAHATTHVANILSIENENQEVSTELDQLSNDIAMNQNFNCYRDHHCKKPAKVIRYCCYNRSHYFKTLTGHCCSCR